MPELAMAASSAAIFSASAWWLGAARTISGWHRPGVPGMSDCIYSMTGRAVPPGGDGADLIAGYIAAWQPSSVPPAAASFARSVAARAGPGTRARANALLWAAARLAAFGIPPGLQPVPEALLHPSVTGRFAASAPGLSGSA